jgi:SAM-dependent methyltransferase
MSEIEEGALACRRCTAIYPVRDGIPRFPLAREQGINGVTRRTQSTYTFTWKRFGKAAVARGWEKDSYRYTEMIPRELIAGEGRVGLDAGCGAGHDLLQMAKGGAQLIGFDLSYGVDVAFQLTRHLPNVHVVEGDLNAAPFRPATFDFVYSFGVLHHLPDPERGFRNLSRLLKPGAPLITYLYEDFSDHTRFERAALAAIRSVRRVTSRLPQDLLYVLCCLAAPLVWVTCSVPARILRWIAPAMASRIPFRHTVRWRVLASDLFDRFAPPVEWRYGVEDVGALYRAAGLQHVETLRYRGWVSWGRRTVVAPRRPGA